MRKRPACLSKSHTRADLRPALRLLAGRNALTWRFNSTSRNCSSRCWFTSWISIISCILGSPPVWMVRSGALSVPSLAPHPAGGTAELRHMSVDPPDAVIGGYRDAVVAIQDEVEAPYLVEAHRR